MYSKNSDKNYYNYVLINTVIFNIGYYNRPNFAAFYSGFIQGTANLGGLTYTNKSITYEQSTMTGLVGFKIQY